MRTNYIPRIVAVLCSISGHEANGFSKWVIHSSTQLLNDTGKSGPNRRTSGYFHLSAITQADLPPQASRKPVEIVICLLGSLFGDAYAYGHADFSTSFPAPLRTKTKAIHHWISVLIRKLDLPTTATSWSTVASPLRCDVTTRSWCMNVFSDVAVKMDSTQPNRRYFLGEGAGEAMCPYEVWKSLKSSQPLTVKPA